VRFQSNETKYPRFWVSLLWGSHPRTHDSRSKDSVVHLWDLPDPPAENFAETPGEPLVLEQISRAEHGDLTSLGWNPDGTLLAIGSYDSVLRVCTVEGSVYFSHPQHEVCIFDAHYILSSFDSPLRRARSLPHGSPRMACGCCLQVLMVQHVFGM
jgi:WD40 repeat protein